MKINKKFSLILFGILISSLSVLSFAQTPTLLKRTDYKTEKVEFGVGGTVSIVGAPNGSITIEGWQKNEVEITAEIRTKPRLKLIWHCFPKSTVLSLMSLFNTIRILSVGTNDKKYIKKTVKKFPKTFAWNAISD